MGLGGAEMTAAGGATASKGTGINLIIEPLGSGVLLSIRDC
jgi:hypothetical protein